MGILNKSDVGQLWSWNDFMCFPQSWGLFGASPGKNLLEVSGKGLQMARNRVGKHKQKSSV